MHFENAGFFWNLNIKQLIWTSLSIPSFKSMKALVTKIFVLYQFDDIFFNFKSCEKLQKIA